MSPLPSCVSVCCRAVCRSGGFDPEQHPGLPVHLPYNSLLTLVRDGRGSIAGVFVASPFLLAFAGYNVAVAWVVSIHFFFGLREFLVAFYCPAQL